MTVDVRIGSSEPTGDITGYSVTEESTPTFVTDMTGGVGQATIGMGYTDEVRRSRRRDITLADKRHGRFIGRGASVDTDLFQANLTADSRMVALVAERTIPPMDGSPGFLFERLLHTAGITTGVHVDPSTLTGPQYAIPGSRDNVWDQVKRLCSAFQLEVALIDNTITLRPIRQRKVVNDRDVTKRYLIDDSQVAQSIIIHYNESSETRADLIHPLGGWQPETQVFSIDAGATETFEIRLTPSDEEGGLGASIPETSLSLLQPACVDYVGREVANKSVYCVAGNDGKPITASQWINTGGKVSVEIGEDTQTLKVTITASAIEEYGPYRIAATAGPSNYYSSLRIHGVGIFYDRNKLDLKTGNDPDAAPTEVGADVENFYLVGFGNAWRAGFDALPSWTGPNLAISATTTDPIEFEHDEPLFGNIGGARIDGDGFIGRVRSTSVTPLSIQLQAECDVTLDDWEEHYGSLTLDQFNALVPSGWTLDDLAVKPLYQA